MSHLVHYTYHVQCVSQYVWSALLCPSHYPSFWKDRVMYAQRHQALTYFLSSSQPA